MLKAHVEVWGPRRLLNHSVDWTEEKVAAWELRKQKEENGVKC